MFGRDDELAAVRSTVARVCDGHGATVVISGEPGIGKTTLLDEVAQTLPDLVVLRAVASDGETELPAATLNALLGAVDRRIDSLRDPHRAVLVSTILDGRPAPAGALGLALVNLFDDLVTTCGPVVIIIDDAQWVDGLSAAALRFALRRLHDRPVAVVAATRDEGWSALDADLVVRLCGVDETTGRRILEARGAVSPSVSARLCAACGGNPLALVQVGRALTPAQRVGTDELPDPVPLAGDLAAVLARRLAGLPERTMIALTVLAASGAGDRVDLRRAWDELGVGPADLDPAELADVVGVDGDVGRFRHPLLRSATLAAAGPAGRRAAHRALAAATSDLERRAHHLDRAVDGPDAPAADALERVAQRAAGLRAYEAAGRAWERAARRSTSSSDRYRFLAEAAQCHWNAGRLERGIAVGREAAEGLRGDPRRAGLLLAVGDMTFFHDDAASGVRTVLDEAETVAATDPATAATLQAIGANLVALTGDLGRASRLVERSVQRATASGDPTASLLCAAMATHIGLVHGQHAPDADRVRALVDLVASTGGDAPRELTSLGQLVVFDLLSLGRWDDAADLGRTVLVQARRHGLASIEVFVHGLLGEVAWRQGRWIEARAESLIEHEFNEARPQPTGSFGHATLARVDAAIGRPDDSRRNATLAADHGRRTGIRVLEAWGLHALGLCALAEGDAPGAVEALMPIWELCHTGEIGAPGPLWWQGDLVEALWRTGRRDHLTRLAQQLDDDAQRTASTWARAMALRAQGLLTETADRLVASADVLDELSARFESARSRALIAEIGADAEYGPVMLDAATAFRRLGAQPWAERIESLLGSSSGDDEALVNRLSRAELRVALLVGRGRTNREVADELFLSPRTVDSHLQRIYRKLRLRSRTELALVVNEQLS